MDDFLLHKHSRVTCDDYCCCMDTVMSQSAIAATLALMNITGTGLSVT